MSMKENFKTVFRNLVGLVMIILLGTSCQSEFDKEAPLVVNDTSFNDPKARKVLLLVVDGLRGRALKDVGPSNITNLLKKSTYSYYSLSDEGYDEGTSWADMFTGVSKTKHEVTNTMFSNNKLNVYPVVFKRIKDENANVRIATFSYSAAFTDNLTSDSFVNARGTYTSDEEVQNALLQELSNENAGVVVGMYKNVNTAGNTNTYESSNQQYKNAILQFDSYVGQAMSALKNRKNYNKENWLVIITSSRGGAASVVNDNTIFSNPKANTFTLIYNDRYQSKLIDKPFTGNPYEGNFVRFYSPGGSTEAIQQASAIRAELRWDTLRVDPTDPKSPLLKSSTLNPLNFNGSDFTIELKVRKNLNAMASQGGTGNKNTYKFQWPMFFGRKTAKQYTSSGWGFHLEDLTWRFSVWRGVNVEPKSVIATSSIAIPDGNWHTLTASIKTEGTQRFLRLYTDGNPSAKIEVPPLFWPTIDNYDSPITIGFIPIDAADPFDGNVSDIKIWRTALPDETIKQYACDTYVSPSHPYYDYLASYWPCRDGAGGRFKNEIFADGNYDFKILKGGSPLVKGTELGNSTVWEKSTYLVCPTSLSNISAAVPNSKDVSTQILAWLGIPVKETWKLDGRVFLNN